MSHLIGSLALLAALATGCGYPATMPPGIYRCVSSRQIQIYRFDSTAKTTKAFIGVGTPHSLEFVDLDTGESVRFAGDNGYTCELEAVR